MKPAAFLLVLLVLLPRIGKAQFYEEPPSVPSPDAPHFAPITGKELSQAVGAPTMVTLRVRDAEPRAVLEALAGQAGLKVSSGSQFRDDQPVTLGLEPLPFWQAVARARLRVNRIAFARPNDTPVVGPSVELGYDDFGQPMPVHPMVTMFLHRVGHAHNQAVEPEVEVAPERRVGVRGGIALDPKIPTSRSEMTLEVREAIDEQGRSLLSSSPRRFFTTGLYSHVCEFNLRLDYPAGIGRRIARIAGVLKFPVVLKTETWQVGDLFAPNAKTVQGPQGPETYSLIPLEAAPVPARKGLSPWQPFTLRIQVKRPANAPPGIAPWNVKTFAPHFHVVSANCHELPINLSMQDDVITLQHARNYRYDYIITPSKLKLVVEIPVEVRQAEIPFEFKNLPLP